MASVSTSSGRAPPGWEVSTSVRTFSDSWVSRLRTSSRSGTASTPSRRSRCTAPSSYSGTRWASSSRSRSAVSWSADICRHTGRVSWSRALSGETVVSNSGWSALRRSRRSSTRLPAASLGRGPRRVRNAAGLRRRRLERAARRLPGGCGHRRAGGGARCGQGRVRPGPGQPRRRPRYGRADRRRVEHRRRPSLPRPRACVAPARSRPRRRPLNARDPARQRCQPGRPALRPVKRLSPAE